MPARTGAGLALWRRALSNAFNRLSARARRKTGRAAHIAPSRPQNFGANLTALFKRRAPASQPTRARHARRMSISFIAVALVLAGCALYSLTRGLLSQATPYDSASTHLGAMVIAVAPPVI